MKLLQMRLLRMNQTRMLSRCCFSTCSSHLLHISTLQTPTLSADRDRGRGDPGGSNCVLQDPVAEVAVEDAQEEEAAPAGPSEAEKAAAR